MQLQTYEKIIKHLRAASALIVAEQGQLSEDDLRIRHLISLTTTEAERNVRKAQRRVRSDSEALSERA